MRVKRASLAGHNLFSSYRNLCGETVLHEAVLARNLEKIMFYCRYPLLVNSRNNCEQTPLHYCSLVNFPEGARILINNGADINALNGLQQTPVMEGALTGSVRFVEYMLSVRQSSQIIKVKRKTICLVTKCKVNPFIKDYKGFTLAHYGALLSQDMSNTIQSGLVKLKCFAVINDEPNWQSPDFLTLYSKKTFKKHIMNQGAKFFVL